MTLYEILLVVHIFSAIIGLGPGFVMTFIAKKSSTMSELRHAFYFRHKIHIFVMVGSTLLLVTGIWMGVLNPILFRKGWYTISIFLYFVTLAAGPFVLKPIMKPIKEILRTEEGEDIPHAYIGHAKQLYVVEHVTNVILIIIIGLMILKPF
ncbi:MAG TPA: DUF2269 family protein [Bacillota bacterium]|nr:DUF2269 family protein [Bacillota bacterium]